VPLDALSAELEAHLATLKQRLVEVINEDYADFVSLSGKLVNVDGAVLRMHRPLLDVKARAAGPAARPGLAGAAAACAGRLLARAAAPGALAPTRPPGRSRASPAGR